MNKSVEIHVCVCTVAVKVLNKIFRGEFLNFLVLVS